ncbi:MAG: sugar ABC transporter ATP-binding protein [Lachnospiraceae bacterium]|nr:sugar ABC transporter ATP-binding protein [Lachnospiraceae bacterium]
MGVLLKIEGLSKSFPGVKALSNVSMEICEGEVRALMGENGAGKSTLIKILTGIYQREEGRIFFAGNEIHPQNATDVQRLGISTIYQEINLIPYLSVAENIFIGREPMKKGRIDWKKMYEEARSAMQDLGVEVDVSQKINRLSTALQQMVAIARALQMEARLFIMDEATSSLDTQEVERLFEVVRDLKRRGIAVIFVSHRMEEIFKICDSVTVLKDGELVGTYPMAEIDNHFLISRMIGRDALGIVSQRRKYKNNWDSRETVLEIRNIKKKSKLNGVNLKVKRGEILGLAGLLGSGRTELAKIIFGEDPHYEGQIFINGEEIHNGNIRKSIERGVVYCPEDRKAEGVFLTMSVGDNLTISVLRSLTKLGYIDKKRKLELIDRYIKEMSIKTPSRATQIRSLSGGNQQKAILSRWLMLMPKLIILDEPTRGIDVGAKAEIEKTIQQLADQGISVIYISSEIEELVRGCDRIAILREGTVFGEISGQDISTEAVLKLIAGQKLHEERN